MKSAYSTNIKERRDCSTALFDHRGNTLCQAEHIPMHLGSFLGVIPAILERFDLQDIAPGDVFMANDAYAGGATHLPDIVLAEPIFVDATVIGWAVNTAHHSDFADRGHDHIFQEGLRIPPVRLYRKAELNTDLQSMFLLNCQVPRERLSDLRAQMSANRLCVQRMTDLCEKYGSDKVLAAADALQDYAERKMRTAIAAIPDGTYSFSDTFDSNQRAEAMAFRVDITVEGDQMRLAFDGPPQVRGGLNLIYTSLLAACYFTVKSVLDPTILPNAGLARPLTVTAPKGTILNCEHPAAVDGRIAAAQRVTDLVYGALAKALPGKVMAAGNGCCTGAIFNGTDDNGDIWVYLETIGGGGGARPSADGLSGIHVGLTNTSNLPVEALELEYPLTLLRYELVDDSAGSGEFRGGMGIRRVYRAEKECRFTVEGSRVGSNPWGLEGGLQADCTHLDFGDGRTEFSGMVDLKPGQIVSIVTPGGGGYGDPAKRPEDAVRRDLAEGRISADLAPSVYNLSA